MPVAAFRINSGACSVSGALLSWRVFLAIRTALILFVLPLAVFGKDIRLRNELIHTPNKSAKAQAAGAARPPVAEAPADGLFLIQFENPINDAQRDDLRKANVELLQAVPDDAFVARFRNASIAKLRELPFVQWVGNFKPEHKIHPKLAGVKENRPVSFLLAPTASASEVAFLKKRIPGLASGRTTSAGTVVRGVVSPNQLNAIAQSHAVLWIEPSAKPKLRDEVAAEIMEGELDGAGALVPSLGFDGRGVVVSVADSGLMEGTAANMHPDLAGRVDAFFHYGQLDSAADEHSHGTHVAGIVAGNGASGARGGERILFWLGIAPGGPR